MLKRFVNSASIIRSASCRYSDAPRQYSPRPQNPIYSAAGQHQAAVDTDADGSDEVEAPRQYRRPPFQAVPMNPPVAPSQSFQAGTATCVFPEESNQTYSIDDFPGLSVEPFPEEVAKILQSPVNHDDVEVKPDGAIYLPEVKYRKILTAAFGAGGWALLPRGPHTLNGITLSREYALFCRGRFISQARGSSNIQGQSTAAASTEAVRSNALMRCCKDLGIASELWDRYFVNQWKERYSIKKNISDRFGNTKIVWMKK